MHTTQQPAAANTTAAFFYTPANYPMWFFYMIFRTKNKFK
jgi:hypothetical protein